MKFYKNEVLNERMKQDWDTLKEFKDIGFLGGGTALALQLGHRLSIDFDFFCSKPISSKLILKVKKFFGKIKILINNSDELTFLTSNKVKITFLYYPFKFNSHLINFEDIKILNILDIASAKAYALNRRANIKDYIDIYTILKSGIKLPEIIKMASNVFGELFSEKLFLSQLLYLEDISTKNFDEIVFIGKNKPSLEQIKTFFNDLIKI
ncbi:MAG: nucleotidyl transferase AbiEii/AbiGii toxin family protein [Patescibacteria group bacterium]|jgi:hypothetical protein